MGSNYHRRVEQDEQFLDDFEVGNLPLKDWHHREHLKMAYLYLRRFPIETALEKVRNGIRKYNASQKVKEGPASGYHETMTQAWMRLVHLILCEYGEAPSADAFVDQHPELAQKSVMRLFYSRDRFMSPEAKAGFLEPDLAALPRPRVNSVKRAT